MNIYDRCFDDQSQLRIRLETAAVEGIFELAEGGALELAWSLMLDYENSLNLVRTVQTRSLAPKLKVIATNPVEFIRKEGESRG